MNQPAHMSRIRTCLERVARQRYRDSSNAGANWGSGGTFGEQHWRAWIKRVAKLVHGLSGRLIRSNEEWESTWDSPAAAKQPSGWWWSTATAYLSVSCWRANRGRPVLAQNDDFRWRGGKFLSRPGRARVCQYGRCHSATGLKRRVMIPPARAHLVAR